MTSGWIQTYSGLQMFPLDAKPEQIDLVDIAHALSQTCRFSGHTRRFYSVAQHCCHVSDWLLVNRTPGALLATLGLLHDATEAYLTDIPRPIKGDIPTYKFHEAKLEHVIMWRFNLPEPDRDVWGYWRDVKEADTSILFDERAQLLGPPPAAWDFEVKPLGIDLPEWGPTEARGQFLKRAAALGLT